MEFPHIHTESEVPVTYWKQQGGEPRPFLVNNREETGQPVPDNLREACRASSHSLKNKEALTPNSSFATTMFIQGHEHRWQRKNRTSLSTFEIPILNHKSKNINLCTFHP